jgi:hypothetical protein
VSAAVNFAMPFCHSYGAIAALAVVLGVSSAGARLNFPAMVAGMFGGPALGSMMGLTLMGFGLGALPGPPVSSVIISATGNDYTASMMIMGALVFLSGILALAVMKRLTPPGGRLRQQQRE